MVDQIKSKYRKNPNTSYFNEFREPEIIEKTKCKPCILSYLIFTTINTGYFLFFVYLYLHFQEYSQNDFLSKSINFNNKMNDLTIILDNLCNNNTIINICN